MQEVIKERLSRQEAIKAPNQENIQNKEKLASEKIEKELKESQEQVEKLNKELALKEVDLNHKD